MLMISIPGKFFTIFIRGFWDIRREKPIWYRDWPNPTRWLTTARDTFSSSNEGLKFSDGTPFDANAVKWSIDRVMRLKGDPSWLVTDFVDRVEVLDKYQVKFVLKNPVAYFPSLVATRALLSG